MITAHYPLLNENIKEVYLKALESDASLTGYQTRCEHWRALDKLGIKALLHYSKVQHDTVQIQSRLSISIDFNYNKQTLLIKEIFKKGSFCNYEDFCKGLLTFKELTEDHSTYRKLKLSISCDNSFKADSNIIKNRFFSTVLLLSRDRREKDQKQATRGHGTFDLHRNFTESIVKELNLDMLFNPLNIILSQIKTSDIKFNDLKDYVENSIKGNQSFLSDFRDIFYLEKDIKLLPEKDFKVNTFFLPFEDKLLNKKTYTY